MRIRENIQALLSIGYVSVVLLGIVFTGAKYSHFGINIFSYSDALDFLIAPFKDMQILIYVLIPLALTFCLLKFDKIVQTKFPNFYSLMYFRMDRKSWFKQALVVQWTLTLVLYTILMSSFYGSKFKENFEEQAEIVLIEFQDNRHVNGKLIGANPNFVFIQDSANTTMVVPINASVKAIRISNSDD